MNGVELIAEERRRQINQEGWTHEHDDTHAYGELADAAVVYTLDSVNREADANDHQTCFEIFWPFEISAFKPSDDRIRELTKAGALIAAEIDRLQRKNNQTSKK